MMKTLVVCQRWLTARIMARSTHRHVQWNCSQPTMKLFTTYMYVYACMSACAFTFGSIFSQLLSNVVLLCCTMYGYIWLACMRLALVLLTVVQTLLGTLSISRLGHRSMDSVDVVPYVHQKVVEMIGVSTREELALCRPPLMKLLYESMSTLWQNQASVCVLNEIQCPCPCPYWWQSWLSWIELNRTLLIPLAREGELPFYSSFSTHWIIYSKFKIIWLRFSIFDPYEGCTFLISKLPDERKQIQRVSVDLQKEVCSIASIPQQFKRVI